MGFKWIIGLDALSIIFFSISFDAEVIYGWLHEIINPSMRLLCVLQLLILFIVWRLVNLRILHTIYAVEQEALLSLSLYDITAAITISVHIY